MSALAAYYTDFVRQACVFSSIALLLYEACETADLEVAFIWARGRARMILLLMTIRHVQLASFVLNAISFTFNTLSPELCTTLDLVSLIVNVIPYFGWAAFLGWRAYALSTSNAFIGLLVFVCSASFASPSVVEIIGLRRLYSATPPTCTTMWKSDEVQLLTANLVLITRPVALLAEIVVFALTCVKTRQAWLSSKQAGGQRSLSDVLSENGVVCFFVVTTLEIVSLLFSVVKTLSEQAITVATLAVFRDCIITVVLSRFILDLAQVGVQINDADKGTKGILTTEWTQSISGVPSQWTLDEEYNGRGFEKEIEAFEPGREGYDV